MKNGLLIIGLLLCCALGAVAVQSYQSANTGRLLMEAFFEARPPGGYGTQRVLRPADEGTDADASILRQAIRYHQDAEYDRALVSFRAYFSGNPSAFTPLHLTLATTAAVASGAYRDAATFVAQMEEGSADKYWWSGMLALRKESLASAKEHLVQLRTVDNQPYPVADLLSRLP